MIMSYQIIRNDELYHHGILGMKWGIRRYQNPDGTLTEAGKKQIRKKAGRYLLPNSVPGVLTRKIENREKVAKKHSTEFDNVDDGHKSWKQLEKEYTKLWNKYKDEYISATLADLKLKDTSEARNFVKKIFSEDSSYNWTPIDWDDVIIFQEYHDISS